MDPWRSVLLQESLPIGAVRPEVELQTPKYCFCKDCVELILKISVSWILSSILWATKNSQLKGMLMSWNNSSTSKCGWWNSSHTEAETSCDKENCKHTNIRNIITIHTKGFWRQKSLSFSSSLLIYWMYLTIFLKSSDIESQHEFYFKNMSLQMPKTKLAVNIKAN